MPPDFLPFSGYGERLSRERSEKKYYLGLFRRQSS
jgi:hypothetical protein